jgi:hypothetical protein
MHKGRLLIGLKLQHSSVCTINVYVRIRIYENTFPCTCTKGPAAVLGAGLRHAYIRNIVEGMRALRPFATLQPFKASTSERLAVLRHAP